MSTIKSTTAYQELLEALQDIAFGAEMMLQPIDLLSSNKSLVRYASEVKRVAQAAIATAKQIESAPHSWQTEDHSPASSYVVEEHEMPATEGPWAHPSRAEAM